MTVTTPAPHRSPTLTVAPTSPDRHTDYLRYRSLRGGPGAVSFLQTAAWARVKPEWSAERLGWFDADGRQLGAALVLHRRLPGARRTFAYVPEGPVLDWSAAGLDRWLDPMLEHLGRAGAFAVRMGPPLAYRRWTAATLKGAVGPGRRIGEVVADVVDPVGASVAEWLREAGWTRCAEDAQPRHLFEIPLAGRGMDDVWSGFSQEWRRNVRKSVKSGVSVQIGDAGQMSVFHDLLTVTERRDGFSLGRSLEYFERQYAEMNAEAPGRMRLYLARHDGETLAAHTLVTLGSRAWYVTGASADHRREVRPSHALQWRMLRDVLGSGAEVYDMRGVPDTLDPADRPYGLMRWKLGTGGQVAETLGEWELPLDGPVNRALHRAMRAYLTRR